jgi:hypothetical protein
MEELDLLKKDWKRRENSFTQVSEPDIYRMIHKSSSSLVKWILVAGILEFVFWTVIGLAMDTEEYFDGIKSSTFRTTIAVTTYVNFVVVLGFIYVFYRNYVRISTDSNTRKLMKDILRTRRIVQYYVWYNLVMIGLSIVAGFVVGILWKPNMAALKDAITHDNTAMIKFVAFLLVIFCLLMALMWVVYRLVYGTLLRRLLANYRELKKIDFD